jgi:hypothetical protein
MPWSLRSILGVNVEPQSSQQILQLLAQSLKPQALKLNDCNVFEGINEEKAIGRFDEGLQRLAVELRSTRLQSHQRSI